jgi:LPXTG-motif cell wall-anchored protein
VYHDRVSDMYLTAVPGELVDPPVLPSCIAPDTGPTTVTPAKVTNPVPRARTATSLADTGADVLAPGVAGLLAVLVGTVLVLVSRRRRPS